MDEQGGNQIVIDDIKDFSDVLYLSKFNRETANLIASGGASGKITVYDIE